MLNSLTKQQIAQLTAQYAALAICIHLLESALPSILGIKPGLANVITLIVLLRYGLKMAVNVQILRVFIASLLNGSLFSPTFLLSVCGAFFSLLALAFLYKTVELFLNKDSNIYPHRNPYLPSAISFSIIAALAHILGQFLLAYHWLIPHSGLLKLLPILLLIALLFGWVNGIMAQLVLNELKKPFEITHYAK